MASVLKAFLVLLIVLSPFYRKYICGASDSGFCPLYQNGIIAVFITRHLGNLQRWSGGLASTPSDLTYVAVSKNITIK